MRALPGETNADASWPSIASASIAWRHIAGITIALKTLAAAEAISVGAVVLPALIWVMRAAIVAAVARFAALRFSEAISTIVTLWSILTIWPVVSLRPVAAIAVAVATFISIVVVGAIVAAIVASVLARLAIVVARLRGLRRWTVVEVALPARGWTADIALSAEIVAAVLVAELIAVASVRRSERVRTGGSVAERISAALAELLLAIRHDDAVVVLGVLEIVLSQHPVSRRQRVARQRDIFFGDVRWRTAQLYIRSSALETPRQWILRFAVVVIIVVTAAADVVTPASSAILLTLPHWLPFTSVGLLPLFKTVRSHKLIAHASPRAVHSAAL